MIKSLIVKELFGVESNNFHLEFLPDLNLLTGRNGSGKTTILKILWCVISGHFDILAKEIDFSYLEVQTDQCEIKISQVNNSNNPKYELIINYLNYPENNKHIKNHKLYLILEEYHASLFFPTFRRVEGGFTILPKIGESEKDNGLYLAMNELSQRLSREKLNLHNHRFIAYVSTNDIVRELDRVQRDIEKQKNTLNEEKDKQIKALAAQNRGLEIVALMDEYEKKLIELEQPFEVLDKLVDKYLQKSVLLPENIIRGKRNTPIPSQRLSAGEKQLFSFLCYNIFAKNSSIFIDEPEISLHPDWQRHLIPLLLAQSTSNQFFMATHSDFIAANYPDKEIILNIDRGF